MSKQVLVDMDGVLADVYAQFSRWELTETGRVLDAKTFDGILESEAFPNYKKHVNTPSFFRTAPVIADSVEALKYLNNKYRVLIVSSATEFPNSLKEKIEWLNEHFPFITWQQMIFCGTKDAMKGDIMIDDHPKNLSHFEGVRLLFEQPHNRFVEDETYKRMNNWKQIMEEL